MKIGDKVRVTHKPERDREYTILVRAERAANNGRIGVVTGSSDSHGLCFEVRGEGIVEAWYEPDELTPVESATTERLTADLAALRRAAVRVTGCDVDAHLSVLLAALGMLPSFEERAGIVQVLRDAAGGALSPGDTAAVLDVLSRSVPAGEAPRPTTAPLAQALDLLRRARIRLVDEPDSKRLSAEIDALLAGTPVVEPPDARPMLTPDETREIIATAPGHIAPRPPNLADAVVAAHIDGWARSAEAADLWDAINNFAATKGVARQFAVALVERAIVATVRRAGAAVTHSRESVTARPEPRTPLTSADASRLYGFLLGLRLTSRQTLSALGDRETPILDALREMA